MGGSQRFRHSCRVEVRDFTWVNHDRSKASQLGERLHRDVKAGVNSEHGVAPRMATTIYKVSLHKIDSKAGTYLILFVAPTMATQTSNL